MCGQFHTSESSCRIHHATPMPQMKPVTGSRTHLSKSNEHESAPNACCIVYASFCRLSGGSIRGSNKAADPDRRSVRLPRSKLLGGCVLRCNRTLRASCGEVLGGTQMRSAHHYGQAFSSGSRKGWVAETQSSEGNSNQEVGAQRISVLWHILRHTCRLCAADNR